MRTECPSCSGEGQFETDSYHWPSDKHVTRATSCETCGGAGTVAAECSDCSATLDEAGDCPACQLWCTENGEAYVRPAPHPPMAEHSVRSIEPHEPEDFVCAVCDAVVEHEPHMVMRVVRANRKIRRDMCLGCVKALAATMEKVA